MPPVKDSARHRDLAPFWGGISFFPPMTAGFIDGFHPGALTVLLLYAGFLLGIQKDGQKIKLRIGGFIWGYFVLSAMIDFGFADLLLSWERFNNFLDVIYFVIILACYVLGVICFRDWIMTRRRKEQAKAVISFPFVGSGQEQPIRMVEQHVRGWRNKMACLWGWIVFFLSSVSLGCLAALIAAAWPVDTYVTIITYLLAQPGLAKTAGISMLLYKIFYLLPVLILTAVFIWLRRRIKTVDHPERYLSKVQICSSAVFFAYGIALTLYYL